MTDPLSASSRRVRCQLSIPRQPISSPVFAGSASELTEERFTIDFTGILIFLLPALASPLPTALPHGAYSLSLALALASRRHKRARQHRDWKKGVPRQSTPIPPSLTAPPQPAAHAEFSSVSRPAERILGGGCRLHQNAPRGRRPPPLPPKKK